VRGWLPAPRTRRERRCRLPRRAAPVPLQGGANAGGGLGEKKENQRSGGRRPLMEWETGKLSSLARRPLQRAVSFFFPAVRPGPAKPLQIDLTQPGLL
jgi:hypothetical protein